jgi:glycosyltransferase involved in cell wall biosynthesis
MIYPLPMNQLRPVSISIICVYNDAAVRQDCLDRSLDRYIRGQDSSPGIEYIPVENIQGTHKSAGAALNCGALAARNDVLVFVHQDVFLHSIEAVIRAAQEMERDNFGLLGAIGIRGDGRIVGLVRDRTILFGNPVAEPTDVDSVDELLFMVPRRLIMHAPITESPDMAWHAYAVEYGLRIRKLGLRVGVAHIPVTHNSLNNNRTGLDAAHARVAAQYRDMLPMRTMFGVLVQRNVNGSYRPWFASQTSRCQRIAAVLSAARKVHRCTNVPLIYADTRLEIDEIISRAPGRRLYIFNNTSNKSFWDDGGFLELERLGKSIFFAAGELIELPQILDSCPEGAWLLVTNMTAQDIEKAAAGFVQQDGFIGFHPGIGFWLLIGAGLSELPANLRQRRLSLRRYRRSY